MKTSLYLARLFGLYMVAIALVMAVSGDAFRASMAESIDAPGFILFGGIMSLVIGLAIVAGHNVWEYNWRVVITVIGYLSAMKGFVLLAWPDHMLDSSRMMLDIDFTLPYALVVGPLGAWLAWIGFRQVRASEGDDSSSVAT